MCSFSGEARKGLKHYLLKSSEKKKQGRKMLSKRGRFLFRVVLLFQIGLAHIWKLKWPPVWQAELRWRHTQTENKTFQAAFSPFWTTTTRDVYLYRRIWRCFYNLKRNISIIIQSIPAEETAEVWSQLTNIKDKIFASLFDWCAEMFTSHFGKSGTTSVHLFAHVLNKIKFSF